MKKTISLLLTLAMVLALAACVSVKVIENPLEKAEGELSPAITEAPAAEPTPEPTAEPTLEPTEEPTPDPTAVPTPEPTPEPTETPEPAPTEVPFEAVEAAANEKLKQVRSLHMDMDMTMDMEMALVLGETRQSIPVDVDVALGLDVIQDPLLIRARMTISAVGTTTDGLIYGTRDGEHTVICTSLDNGATWQKRTDPKKNGMLTAPGEVMDLLLGEDVEMALSGTEDVNGRPAAVYTGKMDGKRIRELLENTGALGEMGGALDVDLPEDALDDPGDMDVTFMIDEESGLPVRYRVDMTVALKYLLTAVLRESMAGEDMEGVELQMDVSSAWLELTLSDFDAVAPFAIPEAALNAPEA